jgi:hypothetical protein
MNDRLEALQKADGDGSGCDQIHHSETDGWIGESDAELVSCAVP